ncbi:hypothetical protein ISCGN_026960 [Ixodes scapularis]
MDISNDSTSRVAQFGSEQSLTNSGSSVSYFSVDETQLDFLGREGVEFEDAACFSFEQVDTLVRNQERVLSYTEKVKLWQYASEIKKQRSKWVQSSLLSSEELDELYGLGGRLESTWCEVVLDDPLPAEASTDCQSTARTRPVWDADTPAPWRHLQPPASCPGSGVLLEEAAPRVCAQASTNTGADLPTARIECSERVPTGEGVEFEDAACFSFEQVDTLVRNQERVLSYTEKVKLWQYASEIKKQRSKWVQSSLLSSEELDELYGLAGRLESTWCEVVLDDPLPAEASADCQSTARTRPVWDADTPAPWRHLQPLPAVQGRGSFWRRLRQGFAPKRPPTREQIFLRHVLSVPSVSPLAHPPTARATDGLCSIFRNIKRLLLRGFPQRM